MKEELKKFLNDIAKGFYEGFPIVLAGLIISFIFGIVDWRVGIVLALFFGIGISYLSKPIK